MLSKLTGASATVVVVSGSGSNGPARPRFRRSIRRSSNCHPCGVVSLVQVPAPVRGCQGGSGAERTREGADPHGASLGITWTDRPAHRPRDGAPALFLGR